MKTYWIVVADAGHALVLGRAEGAGISTLLHELNNPAGRLHDSQIASDRPGRIDKRVGDGRSAMDPPTDPHEQKAVTFAREVCALLEMGADRREFDFLILIAPGHFLGLLHSGLGRVARKRLAKTETKDLTHASLADLERHIGKLFDELDIAEKG